MEGSRYDPNVRDFLDSNEQNPFTAQGWSRFVTPEGIIVFEPIDTIAAYYAVSSAPHTNTGRLLDTQL